MPVVTLEPRTQRHEVVHGRLHEVVQYHHCHYECYHPRRITGRLAPQAALNPEAGAWLVGHREVEAARRYPEVGRYRHALLVGGIMLG